MELPNIPANFFGDFVRGYFDGDGNVWVGLIHKDRKTALKTIQVAFTSGSAEYLKSLKKILQKKGVVGGSLYRPKIGNYARLTLSSKDSFKLYEIMYNTHHKLYLKRKKLVFERFMKMRA
jgi:intein-encoded DNA endonuclease-like protein